MIKNNEEKCEGLYSGLKAISETSDAVKETIRSINIGSLYQISDYYKKYNIDKVIEPMSNFLNSFSDIYKSSISSIEIPSLSIDLDDYADSISKIFISSQGVNTKLTDSINESLIDSNYYGFIKSINNTFSEEFINSSDIAFLKKSDLILSNDSNVEISNSLKRSVKDLNKYSAERLIKTKGIDYEKSTNSFIDSNIQTTKSTSKEMNIICSSMYLFDDYEEELFTEVELMNFVSFLDNTETFASQNQTGQKILHFIEHLNRLNGFDKDIYYHARIREEGERPYTFSEMLCAPTGIMNPGRYNHPGQSYYYFTDKICGCYKEMGKHNNTKIVQVARIKPNKSISMVDLSGTIKHANTLLNYIRFEKGDEPVPKAYLLPCYISDCCRMVGIEGIKYRGSNEYSNYVCWNSGCFDFINMIQY